MQAIMQPHTRPSSAIDHWVASGEQQQQSDQTPPLAQVGFDPSASTSSSSGHHSHEPSVEHSLAPPSSNASGLALAVAAYQTSPRSFDFRTSTASQPSSLRTSYSSYGTSDDALESLRRSYSTTSDIRGTLEETRLGGGGLGGVGSDHSSSEQWAANSGSFAYPTSRRESEPSTFSTRYAQAPFEQHRGSLPYPLERVDALPVRRLRRQPQPGSPGYSSSGAPSLTDGSTSPSTSRGSLVETPYLGASPILEDIATDGRYGQQSQVDSYPFPDMYQAPIHRHSISGGSFYPISASSTPVQPIEMNRHGKRLSVSHDNIEGDRAYSPRPGSSQFGSLPMPPPYGNHTGLPDPAKSAYDYRPESARATSPRGGVYDIDDNNRQVFLPYFPPPQLQSNQHLHSHSHSLPQNPLAQLPQYPPSPSLDLLPPHDSYESIKKRRMSSVESGNVVPIPSPSLGIRREAASSLHLSGLPTPASSIPFEYHHGQHSHSPAYHAYDPSSLPAYASQSQPNVHSHPRTPTSAPALVRSGSYGLSFTSPAFLDNAPPLLLDSPVGSPRKPGATAVGPAPNSPPSEPPCDLPQPPSTSSGGGTAFMDPNYPIDNFTICHRRPPQADFEVVDRLLPRTQDLRFEEDQYTPLWVRQDGKDKEGWCALCPGNGKWLQLKNSAFWYHRQFQHGISSSSGHYFLPPLETRMAPDSSKTEGLCHMCGEYKPYQNHKGSGKGPTPWFRHAHECHQYFSPKKEARKNMKLARSLN